MKCNHCGSEWSTTVESQKTVQNCPFCGKPIEESFMRNQPDTKKSAVSATGSTVKQSNFSPVDFDSSAESFFDWKFNQIQARKNKESEWARILGCAPGEWPWRNIKSSFFVSADRKANKLIDRIAKVHDQELLVCIAKETNRVDVCRAAIKNITDQSVLKQLAGTKNAKIRIAAVENLRDQAMLKQIALNDEVASVRGVAIASITDQEILCKVARQESDAVIRKAVVERIKDTETLKYLASNDKDPSIRKVAFFRIANSAEIKKYLMNSGDTEDKSKVQLITRTTDLIDLALSARCNSIRSAAAKCLPEDSAEARITKAATALSERITAIEVAKFDEACAVLRTTNPQFVKKIADSHLDAGVRYLARGRKDAEPKETTSFENHLNSWTPSQEELRKREEIRKCDYLLFTAQRCANDFISVCNHENASGAHYAEQIYYSHRGYQQPFEDHHDADVVVELLEIELRKRKFQRAVVCRKAHYVKERKWNEKTYRYIDVEKFGGYVVKVSTSW